MINASQMPELQFLETKYNTPIEIQSSKTNRIVVFKSRSYCSIDDPDLSSLVHKLSPGPWINGVWTYDTTSSLDEPIYWLWVWNDLFRSINTQE
jgi:hypothetical protein